MASTGINPDGTNRERTDQLARQVYAGLYPTPERMAGGKTSRGGDRKNELLLSGVVKAIEPASLGSLNPTWVSVLMGYPPNWTEV